mmetsp:Transcript_35917/g.57737  ORF Transcript_35917/g.57737 Transcript_35917/m.57737 type:complete len:246 (-) Transcript_35917:71-808(-)
MLDNIFVSEPMYQKIQDTKIDYSHPKPVWPFSNHLPLIIDLDTTWYGGWGAPRSPPPEFKSIHPHQDKGDQYTIPGGEGLSYQHAASGGGDGYTQTQVARQVDEDHTNYPRDMQPQRYRYHRPMQDKMMEPPPPVAGQADADGDEIESYYDEYYTEDDIDDDESEQEEYPLVMDYAIPQREHSVQYEVIGEDAVSETQTGIQDVLKWIVYAFMGTFGLMVGVSIGYLFADFWRGYKGSVVHISRF